MGISKNTLREFPLVIATAAKVSRKHGLWLVVRVNKKECASAHSRAERGRSRRSSSSRECASLARSAFLFNREVPSNFPVE